MAKKVARAAAWSAAGYVLLATSALILVSLAIWLGPYGLWLEFDPKERLRNEAINAARIPIGVASAALLAFIAALIAAWNGGRSVRQSRRELESREKEAERNYHLMVERGADERLSRAIELLGNEAPSVRLGAIRLLHDIASTDNRRVSLICDLLAEYLRQSPEPSPSHTTESSGEALVRQSALLRLIDLLPDAPAGVPAAHEDLYELDLSGAVIPQMHVRGKRFSLVARGSGTNFQGGLQLFECHLGRVDLGNARGTGVQIGQSRLYGHVKVTGESLAQLNDLRMMEVVGGEVNATGAFIGRFWLDKCTFTQVDPPSLCSSMRIKRTTIDNGLDLSMTTIQKGAMFARSKLPHLILIGDPLSGFKRLDARVDISGLEPDEDVVRLPADFEIRNGPTSGSREIRWSRPL